MNNFFIEISPAVAVKRVRGHVGPSPVKGSRETLAGSQGDSIELLKSNPLSALKLTPKAGTSLLRRTNRYARPRRPQML
jgi:hypothetical protein